MTFTTDLQQRENISCDGTRGIKGTEDFFLTQKTQNLHSKPALVTRIGSLWLHLPRKMKVIEGVWANSK